MRLRALSARYAQAVDQRDAEMFVSTFHEDATLEIERADPSAGLGTRFRSHGQLALVPAALARYSKTFHFLGQSLYQLGNREASGEVYCTANHLWQRGERSTNDVMFIRYQDEYGLGSDDMWRITSRRAVIDWTESRPTRDWFEEPG